MEQEDAARRSAAWRLVGQTAVITGAGRGIGEAIAVRLAAEGAAIAILERDPVRGEEVASKLTASGARSLFRLCDVTRREQVRDAIESVTGELGDITILVNNAGVGLAAPFLDLTDEMWNTVLDVNMTGAFIVAQEVCRRMARNRRGRVVNLASAAAQMAHSQQAAYSVSKAGLEALTRAMAFELAPFGIRVNAVAPGTIETEFLAGMLTDEAKAERVRRIPVGRLGHPDEVASVVAFLVSDDARYVTGCSLPIDGGLLFAGIRQPAPDLTHSKS